MERSSFDKVKEQVGFDNIPVYSVNKDDSIGERASTGWLLKWNLKDKGIWLKSPGYIFYYMWDSYAEVIASAIAKDIGLENVLEYRPCILDIDGEKVFGCESNDYNIPNFNEVTIQKMIQLNILSKKVYYGESGYNSLINDIQENFNVDIRSYLEDIILLDSIILNTDRQPWNISILTDRNYNGQICKIYDNGSSFGFNGNNEREFKEKELGEHYIYDLGFEAKPFSSYYEEQLKYIRNERVYGKTCFYENGELHLIRSLPRTMRILRILKEEFTKENNKYGIKNPLGNLQLQFVYELIQSRYKKVIVNQAWKGELKDAET